jgi:hypothetical protein
MTINYDLYFDCHKCGRVASRLHGYNVGFRAWCRDCWHQEWITTTIDLWRPDEIRAYGRCDCGDQIRHRNGGNYHPAVEVRRESKGNYAVSLVSTREKFPSDHWGDCPCGASYLEGEEHFHTNSPEKVADAILRHLGKEGGSVTFLRRGEVVMSTDIPSEE